LNSRPREPSGSLDADPDVANLKAAIGELQEVVIALAEHIDSSE
jgi:hypothetical protein